MIPFSPPRIDDKTINEVVDALKSGWITTGPKTKLFEDNLAKFLNTDNVVCLNSATAGLQLILNYLDIKTGDEVIVPAYTYCASANVIIHCGAKPIMVDVNKNDFNINIQKVKQAITSKTKAIIAVDIGGFPIDYDELNDLVCSPEIINLFNADSKIQEKLSRIAIIADSAHSIGAFYKGKRTGNQADFTSFSFHAVKNLTTAEGGAVSFNLNPSFDTNKIKQEFKTSSLHGQTKDAFSKNQIGSWHYDVVEAGFKCNMTDLQAAIGLVELERYEQTLTKRKYIFDKYTTAFNKEEWAITPIYETSEKTSSYHLYLLRIKDINEIKRNEIIVEISKHNIAVNVHYIPLAMLSFYKNNGYNIKDYPQTYNNYECEISLPVFYDLKNSQIDLVISTVIKCVEKVLKLR
jgi:dTDP-4-amino-4,6-dideoxygalactose transaminase